MRVLLTAGPTREPIDPVRYLGNRSSGRMGAAIAQACLEAGHTLTLVLGPVELPFPGASVNPCRRIDVETARQMYDAVLSEWPGHDLLIMAAAVADYRPVSVSPTKLSRAAGPVSLDLEPTEDIAAAACRLRSPRQRVIGFSLEREGDDERAVRKMHSKGLDLIVFNPLATMGSGDVAAKLMYPDGRVEPVASAAKADFARLLVQRSEALFAEAKPRT